MPRGSLRSITTTTGRRALYSAAAAGLLFSLQGGAGSAASGYDWPQFDGNAAHSGDNTAESTLTTSDVHALTRLFRVTLPPGAVADGAPAYLSAVATAGGTRDLVFLTTKDGRTLARDAHTGGVVWEAGTSGPRYTTSSPALDPGRQYVYGYGIDGYAHKYAVTNGTEVTTGGWPELTTRKPNVEKGSSALTVATAQSGVSYLYVTNGGYPGDGGDYQGHVTSINLTSGAQTVFNANCSNLTIHFSENGTTSGAGQNDCAQVQTAIWARAGVVYDHDTDKIYMATGNGPFDAANTPTPGNDWGDTVFALHPDGTGTGMNGNPLDSYTPSNYQSLQNADADLGSTAPAILPTTSTGQHLAVQSGKDAKLRLLNLDNLSGQGGPRHLGGEVGGTNNVIAVPQGGEVLTAPAVWVDPQGAAWVFVANNSGLSGLQLTVTNGTPSLHTVWQRAGGRTSPIVANGVLYAAGTNIVEALDPTTGQQLWHDGAIGGIHWESPIVANGVLYITDESGTLSAYALPAGTATNTPQPAPTSTAAAPTSTATALPATNTPVPPTNTSVPTRQPATATPTTPAATPTGSGGAPVPTATSTATALPATATSSPVAATATATATGTSPAPTATGTATAPTSATSTPVNTATTMPTATPTATGTSTPSATARPTITATATPRPKHHRRKTSITITAPRGILVGNGIVSVRVDAEPRTTISITLELKNSVIVTVSRRETPHAAASGLNQHDLDARATGAGSINSHYVTPRHRAPGKGEQGMRVWKTSVLYRTTIVARTNGAGSVARTIQVEYNPPRVTDATLAVTARTSYDSATRSIRIVVVPAHK